MAQIYCEICAWFVNHKYIKLRLINNCVALKRNSKKLEPTFAKYCKNIPVCVCVCVQLRQQLIIFSITHKSDNCFLANILCKVFKDVKKGNIQFSKDKYFTTAKLTAQNWGCFHSYLVWSGLLDFSVWSRLKMQVWNLHWTTGWTKQPDLGLTERGGVRSKSYCSCPLILLNAICRQWGHTAQCALNFDSDAPLSIAALIKEGSDSKVILGQI